MSDERAEQLIDRLSRDLVPVRPLPQLRVVVGLLGVVWLAVTIVGVRSLGARPDLAEAWLGSGGVAAVFVGLALAGAGGTIAALAMSVPGRETLARVAFWIGGAGMAIAAGCGTLLFWRSPLAASPWTADLACLVEAIGFGVLPAIGVVLFAGRAAPFRPLVLALAAAAAAAAIGSVAAQAACPMPDFRHLLMGHVLAPVAGAFLLTLPLVFALRRLQERQARGQGANRS